MVNEDKFLRRRLYGAIIILTVSTVLLFTVMKGKDGVGVGVIYTVLILGSLYLVFDAIESLHRYDESPPPTYDWMERNGILDVVRRNTTSKCRTEECMNKTEGEYCTVCRGDRYES